jgi:U32 family peptidase
MEEENKTQLIGEVTHYFDKIGVAVIKITDGELSIGDTIKVMHNDDGFEQVVTSMQVDHQEVTTVQPGDEMGLKVDEPVKENDKVYKV